MQTKAMQEAASGVSDTAGQELRSRVDHRTGKRIYFHDAAFWASHIDQQRRSGQAIAAYCDRHGLGCSTFRRWAQRLQGRAVLAQIAAGKGKDRQGAGAQKFLAVPIRSPGEPFARGHGDERAQNCAGTSSSTTVEVWLNTNLCVRLCGAAAAQAIARVLAQIEGAGRGLA